MLLASTLLYPAFVLLGISVCTLLAVPRMQSQIARLLSQGQVFWGIATMTALGVVGSRIDFAFSEAAPVEQLLSSLIHGEGVSLNGLLIGGFLGLMLHCRIYHLNTAAFLDVLFPAVMVGIGVSRFGCYFNGCCYGHPTQMPRGCMFASGTDAYRDMLIPGFVADNATHTVRLHPTQIYSAVSCLAIGSLAWQLFRFRRFDGQIAVFTLGAYAGTRILVDAYRLDKPVIGGTGLTVRQIVCCAMLAATVAAYLQLRDRPMRGVGPTLRKNAAAVTSLQ
ncbi:MAG: prolipoprotein diacylglyceryl transferase [Maioricimonas sp. JB049]